MARAKFDKLITDETTTPTKTHLDLQKNQGRPRGSKVKAEQSTASITIALTASQKQELEPTSPARILKPQLWLFYFLYPVFFNHIADFLQ